MKWLDKSFWWASACVAAMAGLCLFAPPAGAGEARAAAAPPTQSPAILLDMTSTASLKPPAKRATGDPTSGQDGLPAGSLLRVSEQGGAWIQPELPPEVPEDPPAILAPTADAPSAPSPAMNKARAASRPVAKLDDETTRAPQRSVERAPSAPSAAAEPSAQAPTGASAWDVEAAFESMLSEKVQGKPIGARDWRAARMAIGVFYLFRGFAPLWTGEGGLTPAGGAVVARLNRASEDGLDLAALRIALVYRKDMSPAQLAQVEVSISQAIVIYAVQASGGRIEPSAISPQITAKPEVADPLKALALVARAGDPDAVLADFNPPQKGYRDLRDKLAQLRADGAPVASLPPGPLLKIGTVDPRVPLIRARFGLDAGAAEQARDASVYDTVVAAAVANFQRVNGLAATGILTPETVEALSEGAVSRREAVILANMEMWRWEPRAMGEERVEVNVPDFTLKVTQGGELVHQARVIVGKPDTPTAIFSNQIKYLLVNPAWNVPMSIIKKEMLPKLVKDPDYLTRAGFEVTQKGDMITVRQPPGERNALGHILFMFPNEHSIYLHDTPARGLFGAPRRAFSHGCVRVDDPMRLGELAMGGVDRGWTQARLRSLVGDTERTLFLPRPLAIHIEYFTAFVDDSGTLQMREDIYGHTRRVEMALGLLSQG